MAEVEVAGDVPVTVAGEALVSLLGCTYSTAGLARSSCVPAGFGRQAVLGEGDRVGEEPRLVIDHNRGQALLSVQGIQVGDRHGRTVRLWQREYRVRRTPLLSRLRFQVSRDGMVVLRAREVSLAEATVRRLQTDSHPDLDPVVALTLIILEARPDRMGVLGELFRR